MTDELRQRANAGTRPMPAATFTCGCRTNQGCTCPYPIDTEERQ
ncbi:hypothetical protein OIU81_03080 [Streptomyces sp. NBC_01454]|nr:hypothetical protein [Streptomyces sp. NBC_01454]